MKNLYVVLAIVLFLCGFMAQGQTTISYNLGDGSTFTNTGTQWDPVTSTTSPDGKLRTQAATSKWHSTGYGISFKNGNSLEIDVTGTCTVRFYGSVYSSGTMSGGTTAGGNDLGTADVKVTEDKAGYYEFSYTGGPVTLYFTFNGTDAYTPAIDITYPYTIYNLGDTSTFGNTGTQWDPVTTTTSPDGKLRTQAATSKWHSTTYGIAFKDGNSLEVDVEGPSSTVRFYGSVYSDGTMSAGTTAGGSDLGTADVKVTEDKTGYYEFSYTGGPTTLYFTFSGSNAYTPAIEVTNLPASIVKADVWDFGAEELDPVLYNNMLTVEKINAWFDAGITPGSSGNVLPSTFNEGILTWTGGANDRLRTTNTSLTRYDENISGVSGYTGRIYVNSGGATGRYMSLTLSEDDEVTLMMLTQSGGGMIHFQNAADPATQDDVVPVGGALQEVKFVAKSDGDYHIFDEADKPSYYRILRKDATYVTLTGTVDETNAPEIPDGYSIDFTNEAGKKFSAVVSGGTYTIDLPVEYTYEVSLGNANGYIIASELTLKTTESTTEFNVTVLQVTLYTVSGEVKGLSDLSELALTYTPDPDSNKIYNPIVSIDTATSTYSVDLEANVEYTISAEGVNDFEILANTITIGEANQTADIEFTAKPLYRVTVNTPDLDETQRAMLSLTLTNFSEEGYTYSFADVDSVALRSGVYTVEYDGLDEYAIELALTPNLSVEGANTSMDLNFDPVSNWSFDDKVITSSDPYYKGLALIGGPKNEIAKGHLAGGVGDSIIVPMQPNQKLIVSYYYTADFTINGGDQVYTDSRSTSTIESVEYIYTGDVAGTAVIVCGASQSTTYFTNIEIKPIVAYKATLTVGADKDYQTINGALEAISYMERPNDERVTVVIDPGNYEEMLVVSSPNVTLTNASPTPSIALLNEGVDIDENAVRITSYYGQKYNFFSQGTDNKWSAEALAVNKANGYTTYENKEGTGGGTSYWNATVVVTATGLIMENIILENSFNQYISLKESQDVVQAKNPNSEPVRPGDYGNTSVQDRSAGYVTQAAAIGIASSADKVILYKCRVIGRQDSFYGAAPSRVVIYKGAMMGAVDYLFGAMNAVFYKTDLVMNTSDYGSDASYLTAAQQGSGQRGYLMYECHVKSTVPGVETASLYGAKPGYFGRPWSPNTSEVVFYKTTIDTSAYPGSEGESLISPEGWTSSLGGESPYMYEFGTVEVSGEDNSSSRASWSTVLNEAKLSDGTDITTFNFTKGNDGWDPLPDLIAMDNETAVNLLPQSASMARVFAGREKLHVVNVSSATQVRVYSLNGSLMQIRELNEDTTLPSKTGIWIVKLVDSKGTSVAKVFVH
ncbi:pectinesterase family protein [Maribellus sediminis]|uniref:pectinesterase family protein n=1 Tax=Maribellus sediminis TaxID=2696285 RepID=UPI001431B221|nr:pectinesterase family protein [Maribellus sediminis]